jgi:hypothetical protein
MTCDAEAVGALLIGHEEEDVWSVGHENALRGLKKDALGLVGKLYGDEVSCRVKVVLAGLVENSDISALGGRVVGQNSIDLTDIQVWFVGGDADYEFWESFVHRGDRTWSANRFIFGFQRRASMVSDQKATAMVLRISRGAAVVGAVPLCPPRLLKNTFVGSTPGSARGHDPYTA